MSNTVTTMLSLLYNLNLKEKTAAEALPLLIEDYSKYLPSIYMSIIASLTSSNSKTFVGLILSQGNWLLEELKPRYV